MNLTSRQNEILDAALHLIATKGIQHLTVRNLAMAIGVTEGAIYRHFTGKGEIIQAMIQRFESDRAVSEQCVGWSAIEAFLLERIHQVSQMPDLARVMFSEEIFQDSQETRQLMQAMMHRHGNQLLRHLQEGIQSGELRNDIPPDALLRLVLGPIRLLVKQWGMSNYAFDMTRQTEELLASLHKILVTSK